MGYVHIYYGDGAGKTTAAMGSALRAAGQGLRVVVAQFLKDAHSGERRSLEQVAGITLLPAPDQLPFTFAMTAEQHRSYQMFVDGLWTDILERLRSHEIDLLVLDEWGDALAQGWFREEDVEAFWAALGDTEVVIATHALSESMRERADYLTEMKAHRHPYASGVAARRGIEY